MMKSGRQRVKIAEACGLKLCQHALTDAWGHTTNGKTWEPFPNYLSDLNACHEMEKVLDPNQMNEYQNTHLRRILTESGWLCRPTAAQRCEAFLKTLGLWEEE